MELRAALVAIAILGALGCQSEQELLVRNTSPTFRYSSFTACANAWLLAFSDNGLETLVIKFDAPNLLPAVGQGSVIELPGRRVDVHVVIGRGEAVPNCGCILEGPGLTVKWEAVSGELRLMSANVPAGWITNGREYFVSANSEALWSGARME